MFPKTLLQHFVFNVRAAAFQRAVTPATTAKNALLAHASYNCGAKQDAPPSYPAAVQTLLDLHEAETRAVTQLFFGPSRFSRFVDWATASPPVAPALDQLQQQFAPQPVTASRHDF